MTDKNVKEIKEKTPLEMAQDRIAALTNEATVLRAQLRQAQEETGKQQIIADSLALQLYHIRTMASKMKAKK